MALAGTYYYCQGGLKVQAVTVEEVGAVTPRFDDTGSGWFLRETGKRGSSLQFRTAGICWWISKDEDILLYCRSNGRELISLTKKVGGGQRLRSQTKFVDLKTESRRKCAAVNVRGLGCEGSCS